MAIENYGPDAFRVWPLALAGAIIFSMFGLPELISHLRAGTEPHIGVPLLSLYALAALAILFNSIAAAIFLLRLRLKKTVSHAVAAVLIFVAFFPFAHQLAITTQRVILYSFPKTYAACASKALVYREQAALKICSTTEVGNSFDMIVYDSGGELALDANQQSSEFKSIPSRGWSVLFTCSSSVIKLKENFYFVQAGC